MGKFIFVSIILLVSNCVYSQTYNHWQKVDTVTSGDYDDYNVQIDHEGMLSSSRSPNGIIGWIVFERWQNGVSSIAGKQFSSNQTGWNSIVTTISPTIPGIFQKYPDVCTIPESISVAAWQQKKDSVWNIYFSYCYADSANWATPIALTNDTVSNTNVKVRTLADSRIILIWRRDASVLYSVVGPTQFSNPKPLATSNFDSSDYDFGIGGNYAPTNTFVWTRVGDSGNKICLISAIQDLGTMSLAPSDTVACDGDISNPRFISFAGYMVAFTFDLKLNNRYEARIAVPNYYTGRDTVFNIEDDTTSSNLHAVSFVPVQLTGIDKQLRKTSESVPFGFYAWEHRTENDTAIVFSDRYGLDTMADGRNPSISNLSSQLWNFAAWESNQTGRSHIYSRSFNWTTGAIDEPSSSPPTFILHQNYPNPFNPTTKISYRLSAVSRVTLTVYDVLGRIVKTLVDARQTPGEHSVTFDSGSLTSGVYFYSLRANGFTDVGKMLLIK